MNKKWLTALWRFAATGYLLLTGLITACGTLNIGLAEPSATPGPAVTPSATRLVAPPTAEEADDLFPAVAWYGSVHSLPESGRGDDYLKLWHLAIWPKFGQAVGLTGVSPAVKAEIERVRDRDIKATFWGDLDCSVADYGACQLLVERISANDGGPQYDPDRVEGWQGRVGRLYFVLEGRVVVLYGIVSDDPAIQAELERLADQADRPEGGDFIRIWGELGHKAQPVTGTVIDVDRLELVGR